MRILLLCAVLFLSVVQVKTASAAVKIQTIEYKDGTTILEGIAFSDDAIDSKTARPGVLVVPAWKGIDDNAKKRATELAKLGYTAFVADIYGKGIRPKTTEEAGTQAGKYKSNRALFRSRVTAGFKELIKQPGVDPARTAAIGYCFGGTAVLELARSGAPLSGVVTFHGGLDSPTPADGKNIKAKLLILHGAEDPYLKKGDIEAFVAELTSANVDYQMTSYSGAVHCFTHADETGDKKSGCAYNKAADARSWAAMKLFFDELFGKK